MIAASERVFHISMLRRRSIVSGAGGKSEKPIRNERVAIARSAGAVGRAGAHREREHDRGTSKEQRRSAIADRSSTAPGIGRQRRVPAHHAAHRGPHHASTPIAHATARASTPRPILLVRHGEQQSATLPRIFAHAATLHFRRRRGRRHRDLLARRSVSGSATRPRSRRSSRARRRRRKRRRWSCSRANMRDSVKALTSDLITRRREAAQRGRARLALALHRRQSERARVEEGADRPVARVDECEAAAGERAREPAREGSRAKVRRAFEAARRCIVRDDEAARHRGSAAKHSLQSDGARPVGRAARGGCAARGRARGGDQLQQAGHHDAPGAAPTSPSCSRTGSRSTWT